MKKFKWTMVLSIMMLLISCGKGGEKPADGNGAAPAAGPWGLADGGDGAPAARR